MSSRESIICGLDIGSSAVRVVVGQLGEKEEPTILAAVETPSEGVSKGTVTSIEDAVSSISQTLEKAERLSGVELKSAYVGISGTHILSQDSHGVVAVGKANGEIQEDDVERVIEAAQAVATPPNYEIIHVIPRSFSVDGQMNIKDPVGMSGVRLEVDAQIIQGLSSQIRNVTKSVYRTGLDINDLVLGILACSEAVLEKRQKELGVALVNIGSNTTSFAVFEEGDVLHTAILPIGASHITSDIAIGLRTAIDVAENVKLDVGTALLATVKARTEIDLEQYGADDKEVVSVRKVSEIIEARLEEIFGMVDDELQKIDRSGMLPAGIILTGGGAHMHGVVEFAREQFKLPAAMAKPVVESVAIERVQDPSFSTALGLMLWGAELEQSDGEGGIFGKVMKISNPLGSIKGIFDSFKT
ncbi:MAG: cell division protein FtsA [Patescibacteria group bacterium]